MQERMNLSKRKSIKKLENQEVWTKLEKNICFLRKAFIKGWRQIHEINKNGYFMECFTAIFFQPYFYNHILPKNVKIRLLG